MSFKMSKESCGVIGNVLLRKKCKSCITICKLKNRLSSEDPRIIKFTIYINNTDLFTKVSVCRELFCHQRKRVG